MCPDKSILSAYFDGEVDSYWSKEIENHLTECKKCSSYIIELKKQKSIVHLDILQQF